MDSKILKRCGDIVAAAFDIADLKARAYFYIGAGKLITCLAVLKVRSEPRITCLNIAFLVLVVLVIGYGLESDNSAP